MILLSLSSSVYDILALFSVMCDQSKLSAVFWYYSADEVQFSYDFFYTGTWFIFCSQISINCLIFDLIFWSFSSLQA